MRKEFRDLISLEEARRIVLSHPLACEPQDVPLSAALGRVLDERITSRIDVPSFDRASMDGYAVQHEDTLAAREDRPIALQLIGSAPMGSAPEVLVGKGQAAEVSTGSMMPEGADCVVMVEYAEVEGQKLLLHRPAGIGENVTRAGSDIAFGETLIVAGTRITPREIGVLAAIGRMMVRVRSMRLGVASTGDELAEPGGTICPGQVYDVNSYTIAAAAEECGAKAVLYGILPDKREEMAKSLIRMAGECSAVIVSGSTSSGAGDMVYSLLEEVGELIFHGIDLKPGKPTIYGSISGKPFFGLPGYPTSALTVFGKIAAPAIREALGTGGRHFVARGRLSRPVRSESRHQMLAVGLSGDVVYAADKGSGSITTLSQADGVIEIPSDVEYLDRGEVVDVELFGEHALPDLTLSGESCPILESIIESLPMRTRLTVSGRARSMAALLDGAIDIAAISGFDDLPEGTVIIQGYQRELGLASMDPELLELIGLEGKRILGWQKDYAPSRSFYDLLNSSGLKEIKLSGLARSHSSVAAALASGRADLGFCVRAAADAEGLAFRPISCDILNFAISEEKLDAVPVKHFQEALRSFRFPHGSSPLKCTGEVVRASQANVSQ